MGDDRYYYGSDKESWKSELIEEIVVKSSRLSERAFAWQYPRSYQSVFKQFMDKYLSGNTIEGFAYCIDDRTFILVPTIDKLDMALPCRVQAGQKLPDDHSYIQVKGRKGAVLNSKKSSRGDPVFIVDDFQTMKVDERIIQPDIKLNDFQGLLFDNWSDIPDYIIQSISLSITSSPPDLFRPVSGLTTDLFLDREQRKDLSKAKFFVNDLRSRLDEELYQDWSVALPTGKRKLNPLKWKQYSLDADREDSIQARLLMRQDASGAHELSLNLGSSRYSPPSIEDLAVNKSDLPLILPPSAERRRRGTLDIEIAKYIIATHQNFVTSPRTLVDTWLPRIIEKIEGLRLEFHDVTAFSQIVNPDSRSGLTRSVIHTSLALSRGQGDASLSESVIEESLKLQTQAWRTALEKWSEEKAAPTHMNDQLRAFGPEQRQIYYYLLDHPDLGKDEIKYILFPDMKATLFESLFGEMHSRGWIHESYPHKFRAT